MPVPVSSVMFLGSGSGLSAHIQQDRPHLTFLTVMCRLLLCGIMYYVHMLMGIRPIPYAGVVLCIIALLLAGCPDMGMGNGTVASDETPSDLPMTEAVARDLVLVMNDPESESESRTSRLLAPAFGLFNLLLLLDSAPDRSLVNCPAATVTGDLTNADGDTFPVDGSERGECSNSNVTVVYERSYWDHDDSDPDSAGTFAGSRTWTVVGQPVVQSDSFEEVYTIDSGFQVVAVDYDSRLSVSGEQKYRLQWAGGHSFKTDSPYPREYRFHSGTRLKYTVGSRTYDVAVASRDLRQTLGYTCPTGFSSGQLRLEDSFANRLLLDYTCQGVTATYNGKELRFR